MARKPKEAGFESTLAELEELVARMEAGNLPLEEAMRSFERGVQLTRGMSDRAAGGPAAGAGADAARRGSDARGFQR